AVTENVTVSQPGLAQGTLFDDEQVSPSVEKATIESVPHEYLVLETPKELEEFVVKAMKRVEICFDTETTSINPLDSELVAISFS
ncbi:MAG TPA: hypothetical protein DCZ51_02230, partial [Bacteroidales bacterium]|nr:hypothetical protein [Bacteroidales bacterium]